MSSIARLFLGIGKAGLGSSDVAGESPDAGYKGKIELDSWEWGLERKANQVDGRVKPEPSTFRFTKAMDKSTTQLLNKLISGEALLATLTLIEDSDLWFELSVYMVNARVIKYSLNGKDESKGGRIDESWVMNYDKIHFEHTEPAANKSSKTVTSNSLWRPIGASTASPDTVKKVVDSFSALKSPEKVDAIAQISKNFPDEMKGQTSAPPKASSANSEIQKVVKAFGDLTSSERKKAREQIDKLT